MQVKIMVGTSFIAVIRIHNLHFTQINCLADLPVCIVLCSYQVSSTHVHKSKHMFARMTLHLIIEE